MKEKQCPVSQLAKLLFMASLTLFPGRYEHAIFMPSINGVLHATQASYDTCHCCVQTVLLILTHNIKFRNAM